MNYWVTSKNKNPMKRQWISGPSSFKPLVKHNQSEYVSLSKEECEANLRVWNPNYGTGTIVDVERYDDQAICNVEWDLLIMGKKNSWTISYHHLIAL
jgi:hypothetical protein